MHDDNPSACDHCRHGDHATCDRWFRDVCRCDHGTAGRAVLAEHPEEQP
jgi:hypothetical protein